MIAAQAARLAPLAGAVPARHYWRLSHQLHIAADSWGEPGSARGQVIFLHGLGQTRHAWRKAACALAQRGYHCITFDARGHGDSSWAPDGDYSFDTLAQDLQLVIERLGNRRPIVVGASMGGSTAIRGAGAGPLDLRGLVLVDIVPNTAPAGVEKVRDFMRATRGGFDHLEQVAQAIAAYKGGAYHGSLEGLKKNVRRNAQGRLVWHWDPALLERPFTCAATRQDWARQLTLPLLLIRGADSDVVTAEGAAQFLALCPQARHVEVQNVGHMVSGDDNDPFLAHISQFIAEVTHVQRASHATPAAGSGAGV